jgi:hypothetical protein
MSSNKSVFNWQLYLGIVLVVTGGLFLADQLLDIQIMRFFWPLLLVLFGLTFFIGMVFAGKRGAGLAIPGALITTIGLLLFIQNTFNLWVTWTYAWGLLISATGLGMLIMNIYLKRVGVRRVAGLLIGIGLTLFVVFGLLFEIILNIAGTNVDSGLFLGGGLVLLGFFVIFSRPLFIQVEKSKEKAEASAMDADFKEVEAMPQPSDNAISPLAGGEAFSRLRFKSIGRVHLLQGESCGLKIEGEDELLEKVKARVVDGVLNINYEAEMADWVGLSWIGKEHRLRYFVTVENLTGIELAGAGEIRGEKLKGETLTLKHSGAGKLNLEDLHFTDLDVGLGGLGEIRLTGEVQSQKIDLSGAGSYHAEDLKSQSGVVTLSGAGSVIVWVEGNLTAKVSGAGSIKYKGSPNVQENNTGLGKIKPL